MSREDPGATSLAITFNALTHLKFGSDGYRTKDLRYETISTYQPAYSTMAGEAMSASITRVSRGPSCCSENNSRAHDPHSNLHLFMVVTAVQDT